MGVKSYQAQTNKARSAEAKHSLSYIYTAEANFKSNWKTYHENLMLIGAVPSGSYHYDVGFEQGVAISKTDGDLGSYPLPDSLTVKECINFKQICKGDCIANTRSAVGSGHSSYFLGSATCKVTSGLYLGGVTPWTRPGSIAPSIAEPTKFKAFATGKLKRNDVWSIDEMKTIKHELDGTQ